MKLKIFFFAIVFSAFFILWRPNLEKTFQGRDDWEFYHDTFYRPGLIQPFDPTQVTENYGSTSYYQPLANVTFNLIHGIFGGQARPFYLFGFFLHGLNAVLVYRLVMLLTAEDTPGLPGVSGAVPVLARSARAGGRAQRGPLTHKESLGCLSAAVFLLYPANLQTISWIGAILIHPIATFFYLLCFLYFVHYLKTHTWVQYSLALFFFFCACLSKIIAVSFIPAAVLFDLFFFAVELKEARESWFQRILNWFDKYIPFIVLALFFIAVAVYKYPTSPITWQWGGVTLSAFTALRFFDFLTWLFFPFYSFTGQPLGWVILTFALTAFALIQGTPLVRFLALWIVVCLLSFASSNFRDLSSLSRYLYLPSVPFSILVSSVVFATLEKIKFRSSHRGV